ncbi:condensation domain-containing protein [Kribbella italica]|uniref:Carrier domain-containing protein n=1 Tax=Kribbella italica TaxID=1540520 RepID=A0A7W9MU70_9ACTN|nr:condensation domain-containing protein [Kribbella italica]MBB5835638.1 hypothetical protein [Kribbella italica]
MTEHIPTVPRTAATYPLSLFQRALYVVEQLHPGTGSYNVPVAVRFGGPLDETRLEQAIGRIVARHEAARTTFPDAAQRIGDGKVELPVTQVDDEAGALELVRRWAGEPFELETGPLLRTRLIRLTPEDHILVVVMHQLVTDGPSLQLFLDELADGYAGLPEPPKPQVQPIDHAAWQLDRSVAADDVLWWKEQLAGVPTELRLPTDYPRPRQAATQGANHVRVVPAAVMTRVLDAARQLRVTPFVLMITAYAALLARLSGQPKVLVGVPVSARDQADLEPVIGFFVNTLPVVVDTTGDPGFAELCQRVRGVLLDTLEHADVPLDRIVAEMAPERDPGRAPLVQAYFSFEPTPIVTPRLEGTSATVIECPPDDAKVDLDLTIFRAAPLADDFRLTFTYRTDLLAESTVAALADRLERLLVSVVDDPALPLPDHQVLKESAAEPEQAAEPRQVSLGGDAQSELEHQLTAIWQDVLGTSAVGRNDNFFDLGGTSFTLLATQSRLRELTGSAPPLVALLEYPTVASLAQHLGGAVAPVASGPAAGRRLTGRDRLRQRRELVRTDDETPS